MRVSVKNRAKIFTLVVAAGLALALTLSGCSEKVKPGTVEVKRGKAGPVKAMTVREEAIPVTYVATGTVRARESATISPQIMGRVLEVKVREGDVVKKGDLLLVIDDSQVKAGVRAAKGMVDEAEKALVEVEAAIKQAESAKNLAEKTYKRFKKLYEEKIISQQEFDEVETKYEMAVRQLEIARAKKAQVEAKLDQAKAGLEQAKVSFQYTRVRAPFDGIVAKKFTDPGNLVSPGVPLFVIDRVGAYQLVVEIPEQYSRKVKVGDKVTVDVESAGLVGVAGTVSDVVPALNPSTRSFTVKVDLPEDKPVRSGMFGRASFAVGEKKGIFLPEKALVRVGGYEGAYLLTEENIARFMMIRTGLRKDGKVEILSGLVPGQRVVISGLDGLKDGDVVEVVK